MTDWLSVKYNASLASFRSVSGWYQHLGYCLRRGSSFGQCCLAMAFRASLATPLDLAAAITRGPKSPWKNVAKLMGNRIESKSYRRTPAWGASER